MLQEVHEAEERARGFFRNVIPEYVGAFYVEDEKKVVLSLAGGPCHARLINSYPQNISKKPKFLCFASNFKIREGFGPKPKEATKKFWEWVSDPEISPWRYVFKRKKLEVLKNKHERENGFLFPYESLIDPEIGWKPTLNFAYAARTACEKHWSCITFWHEMVEKGVDPAEAFVLSGFYQSNDNVISPRLFSHFHWPVWFDRNFSLNRFKEGKFINNPRYISSIFSRPETVQDHNSVTEIATLLNQGAAETIQTSFSSYIRVKPDVILINWEKVKGMFWDGK